MVGGGHQGALPCVDLISKGDLRPLRVGEGGGGQRCIMGVVVP